MFKVLSLLLFLMLSGFITASQPEDQVNKSRMHPKTLSDLRQRRMQAQFDALLAEEFKLEIPDESATPETDGTIDLYTDHQQLTLPVEALKTSKFCLSPKKIQLRQQIEALHDTQEQRKNTISATDANLGFKRMAHQIELESIDQQIQRINSLSTQAPQSLAKGRKVSNEIDDALTNKLQPAINTYKATLAYFTKLSKVQADLTAQYYEFLRQNLGHRFPCFQKCPTCAAEQSLATSLTLTKQWRLDAEESVVAKHHALQQIISPIADIFEHTKASADQSCLLPLILTEKKFATLCHENEERVLMTTMVTQSHELAKYRAKTQYKENLLVALTAEENTLST